MIPIILIAAAVIGVTAGVSLTAMFWEDIKKILKDTLEEIKRLADRFVKGCKVFLRKVKRSFVTMVKVITSYYSMKNHVWERICYQEELEESQVPPEILVKTDYNSDLDITEELKLQLM